MQRKLRHTWVWARRSLHDLFTEGVSSGGRSLPHHVADQSRQDRGEYGLRPAFVVRARCSTLPESGVIQVQTMPTTKATGSTNITRFLKRRTRTSPLISLGSSLSVYS